MRKCLIPVVSITRLRIRKWRFLLAFIIDAQRSASQARKAPGNLGVKLLRDRRNTFWTCTCWSSESDLKAFVLAKPHGAAMRKLLEWCDEAALVHFTQPDSTLPSWSDAYKRILAEGRPSKVNHPSTDHTAHAFPAPNAP